MIELAGIFLVFVVILGVAPASFGGVRNANGIFMAYSIAGVFLPAILSLATGQPGPNDVVSLLTPFGFTAIVVSVLAFFVTLYVSVIVERFPVVLERRRFFAPNSATVVACAIVSILLSAVYLVAMTIQFGGFSALAARLYQRTNFDDSSANILQTLTLGAFVFSVFAMVFARGLRGRPQIYALASIVVFFLLCLLLGGRSNLGLLAVAIFYLPFIRMRVSRAALSALFAIILFGIASFTIISLRKEAQGNFAQTTSVVDGVGTAMRGLTFVDHVAASVEYAAIRGHDYGQVYLNVLTSPLPRDLWPSKPLPISIEMRAFLFGDTQGGAPPGILGEAFIAFGSVGTLAAAALLGFLLGKVNSTTNLALRFDCRLRTAIAGIFAPLVAFSLVRGGFDASTTRIAVTMAFTVMAAGLCYYTAPTYAADRRRSAAPRNTGQVAGRPVQGLGMRRASSPHRIAQRARRQR